MFPTLTILTTVFNGEEFLEDAVSSILGQSYSDFEYLIVEDCSTDQTREVLASIANRDSRIRILQNDSNIGQTRSLCKGMAEAAGEYVARLDADDIAMPGRLETQHRFLQDNPDVSVVGSACELIDETQQLTGEQRGAVDEPEILGRILFYNPLIHSSVMFRKEPILAIGGYRAEFTRAQDYDLWIRCLASGLRMTTCPEVLVRQRMHRQRVTYTQPGAMEVFRKSAIQNGWKSMVGIDVPDWILEETDHLLWTDTGPKAASFKKSCIELRRLRSRFASRFHSHAGAVAAFDRRINMIVAHLCKSFDVEPILYQRYVRGLPFPAFALSLTKASTALKKSSDLTESIKRSWLYNCRPMRWIRSQNSRDENCSRIAR